MKHYLLYALLTAINGFAQITPDQMVSTMGRGINIGNVLSAPIEGNWAPVLEQTYIQDIATVGFKTVRIPMDFFGLRTSGDTSIYSSAAGTAGSYTGTASDYVVSSIYLDRVEEVITWGLDEGLVVILDVHGAKLKEEFLDTFDQAYAPALYTYPDSAKRAADNDKFRAIWAQIADRLKDYDYNLVFEVVNEPYFRLSESEMNVLNTDVIDIVRNSGGNNTYRNIIITGGGKNSWEAPMQITASILSGDSYLIPTFHYYLPFKFTSSSRDNVNDVETWGSAADKNTVDNHFEQVQTWAQNNSVPILLGEFGADNTCGYDYINEVCGSYGGPENASRVAYHEYLAEKAIALGFAFTAWDAGDKSNKTIYKVSDRTWVEDVKEALLGTTLTATPVETKEKLRIFPNPAKDQLKIVSLKKIDTVDIFQMNGQLYTSISDSNTLNVSNFHDGLYLLKIMFFDGQIANMKLAIHKFNN